MSVSSSTSSLVSSSSQSIYGPNRVRLAIKSKGQVDIWASYKDLYQLVRDAKKGDADKFYCLICRRRAKFTGAVEEAKDFSQSFNLVSHLSRCAPEELVAEHADNESVAKVAAKSLKKQSVEAASSGPLSYCHG